MVTNYDSPVTALERTGDHCAITQKPSIAAISGHFYRRSAMHIDTNLQLRNNFLSSLSC
jgi:hypothetical protein